MAVTTSSSEYSLSSDGHKLYQKIWSPPTSTPRKAHIIFLHGFSDRIDHYDAFFNVLTTSYPIRVIAWDRRGWGKSVHGIKADRGNTGTKEQQILELNELINHALTSLLAPTSGTPVFLMGHSMGGQEATYYMLNSSMSIPNDQRPKLAGFILESPFIGLDPATQPSALKVSIGRIAAHFMPKFSLFNPVKAEFISRDPQVVKMYKDDPLCPGYATLESFRDMLEREAELQALGKGTSPAPETLKAKLDHPVLWTHGTDDRATDYPASKRLCERLEPCGGHVEDKVFKSYEGWYHQLHNEPNGDREKYAKDVADWVLGVAARGR